MRATPSTPSHATLRPPLLLLGVASDVVLEEQPLPGDVGGVLAVLVVVQLLPGLGLRVRGGLLRGVQRNVEELGVS